MVEGAVNAMLPMRTLKVAAWSACALTTTLALARVVLAIIEPAAARASSDVNVNGGGLVTGLHSSVHPS